MTPNLCNEFDRKNKIVFISRYLRSESVGILRDLTFHSDSDVTELLESNIGAGMRL